MNHNWTYKKLGDCFPYIKNGANIKQGKNANGYPITRIETLAGGVFNRDRMGYANIYELDKYADYLLSSRDLLMSHINSKAYIGRTVEYVAKDNDERIIHGMNLLRLKSNNAVIDSSFFVYYTHCHAFTSAIAKIRKDAVNQSSFSISDLKNIPIPLPPLETQSRIVSELDLLQAIIDKQKAQLAELDNLAQCIFYDMFGDPVDNDKGWEVKKLGKVCEIIAGGDKPEDISNIKTKDYCYPVIANGDGDKGILGYCRTKRVSCDAVTIGARGASIGNCRIVSGGFTPVVRLIVLMPNESVNCTYLFFFAKQMPYYSNGAGQAQLTVPNVRDVSFILPPLSLQQSFAAKIESIEKQKAAISQSIAETQKLFNFTMDKYFG